MALVIHIGAGSYENPANDAKILELLRGTLEAAASLFEDKVPIEEIVVKAVTLLEESPLTNAGKGSNLTANGTVECDASVARVKDGIVQFASIGAICGVDSPAQVALHLLQDMRQDQEYISLVSDQAWMWAMQKGLSCAKTHEDQRTHNHTRESLRRWEAAQQRKFGLEERDSESKRGRYADTVGCAGFDGENASAVSVSSGGPLLRQNGRIGPAALWGCGSYLNPTNAICASGDGEALIMSLAASAYAESKITFKLPEGKTFALLWLERTEGGLMLHYAFTSPGFAIGYLNLEENKIEARVLRRNEGDAKCVGRIKI